MIGNVKNENIEFHDEIAESPNYTVKESCLLLILASTEIEKSLIDCEKFVKKGKGRNYCPKSGKSMSKNQFKAFLATVTYYV